MAADCVVLSSDDDSSPNYLYQPMEASQKDERRAAHFLSESESSDSEKSQYGTDPGNARSDSPHEWPKLDTYELDNVSMKLGNKGYDYDRDIPSGQDIGKLNSSKGPNARPLSKEERAVIKEIKMREKAEKSATRERLRQMKPGECIKFMKVIIDSNLIAYPMIYSSIENALKEYGAELRLQLQPITNAVTWSRSGSTFCSNGDEEDCENNAIIIWHSQKFSNAVCNKEIAYEIQQIKENLPNKRITLIIYSGSDFDMRPEGTTRYDFGNANDAKRKKNTPLNKKRMEMELVRLQFEHDCSYRIIDAKVEVGIFIAQFTKAISEIPYRKGKQRQEQELAWLASADSRSCVRVDKSSNGLSQLWTQQLLQFNNCNLDAVNEITKRYPTPQILVNAYNRCTSEQEAVTLLKDILIVRKCIGDLAAKRKLGRELSRKLYLLFTCKDPNVQLSNE